MFGLFESKPNKESEAYKRGQEEEHDLKKDNMGGRIPVETPDTEKLIEVKDEKTGEGMGQSAN